jgi:hypothetical protein
LLIEPPLLFLTALGPATGLLPLLEPRMGMKPTTTERTPPPREHIFPSSKPVGKETNRDSQEKERKQKGKAIETDLRKKKSEGWRTSHILRIFGRLTSYNHHVWLLSPEPGSSNNHSLLGSREPALL